MYKISVIVPIFNGEPFIEALLLAFDNQSFRDFEVIFIDDGSTDATVDILRAHMGKATFPFQLFQQGRRGVSSARNQGVALAKGQYLCFVDADDLPAPGYLAYLFEAVTKHACRVGVGMMVRKLKSLPTGMGPLRSRRLANTGALEAFLNRELSCGLWTTISERALWQEHGLAFQEGYRYGEDLYVLWKLLALGDSVAVVDNNIYYYRNHIHSAMNQPFSTDRKHILVQLAQLEGFFEAAVPSFAAAFKQYGVARNCWTIVGRAAFAINDFKTFSGFCALLNAKSNLRKLRGYPCFKVRSSSFLFCRAPFAFFILFRVYVRIFARYLIPAKMGKEH